MIDEDYNVMIDDQNFVNIPVKNDLRTLDNILKTATGQGDDYTAGCLLYYNYFNKYYKMIMLIRRQYNKLILQEF